MLEAVRLLVSDGSFGVIRDVLNRREEDLPAASSHGYSAFSCLFRRDSPQEQGFRITSGERFLSANTRLLRRLEGDEGAVRYEPLGPNSDPDDAELYFEVNSPGRRRRFLHNERFRFPGNLGRPGELAENACVFIGTGGLSRQEFTALWSGVALTEMEDRINRSMRECFSEVERISAIPMVKDSNVIAKVRGSDRPVSLKSIGEGANRLFGLALAVANARNGVLLVDEVEIGLHYSNQIALWRLLVQMALEFRVQIFATTHSEDAIRAFSIATKENEAVEGQLIRLQSRGGQIEAVAFDEDELVGARDAGSELR